MAVVFCEVPASVVEESEEARSSQAAAPAKPAPRPRRQQARQQEGLPEKDAQKKKALPLQPVWVDASDLRIALGSSAGEVETQIGRYHLFPVSRKFFQIGEVSRWLGLVAPRCQKSFAALNLPHAMPVSVLVLVSRAASRLAARHEGELKHWQSLAPSRRGQAGLDDEIFYTGFLQEGIIQSGLQDGVIHPVPTRWANGSRSGRVGPKIGVAASLGGACATARAARRRVARAAAAGSEFVIEGRGNVVVLAKEEDVLAEVAAEVASCASAAIEEKGAFSLCVPAMAEESFLLAKELWIDACGIPADQVHPVPQIPSAEGAAAQYTAEICMQEETVLVDSEEGLPALDLLLLHVGPDGTVGRLKPNSSEIDEAGTGKVVLPIEEAGAEAAIVGPDFMNAARSAVLLATGSHSAQAVQAALKKPSASCPASLLRTQQMTWMLDSDCATLI
eukprot:g15283.t1